MKLTLTLDTAIATDAVILSEILGHLGEAPTDVLHVGTPEEPLEAEPGVVVGTDTGVDDVAAKKARKAAQAKARREAKKAKEAEAVDDDPLGLEDDAPEEKKTKAPKATEADLKKAVKVAIETNGIETVREAFAEFKSKAGEPCVKMSDVKPGDIAAVIAKLEEA